MYSKPRIYISSPVTAVLDRRRQNLKKGILKKVIGVGFDPQEFGISGIPERWVLLIFFLARILSLYYTSLQQNTL